MQIAFITVGDTRRLTGGYLYHAHLFAGLRARGVAVAELVAGPAPLADQRAAAAPFGASVAVERFDAVVIDALARGVCAPWVARWQALRPVVVLVHELPSVADGGADPAELALEAPLLHADRLIAVSEHGRAILLARGVPPERIAVVAPGYDRLAPPAAAPSPAGPAQPLRALCVAQWIPRKGIVTLVAAWCARPRAAMLELIGETDADPAYAAEVRAALAAAPGASIGVRGPVADADLARAYAAADLFVLPSRYEGYGMVYAEALAHGLPVIAGNVGPVPALVGGAAGLFVPPDDPPALAAALDRLLGDATLRRQMAAAARARAAALPRWDDTVAGFLQVLAAACAR